MKKEILFALFFLLFIHIYGQSPYKIKPIVDVPILIGGAALAYPGYKAYRAKPWLDSSDVIGLSPRDVNKFDRGAAYNFPESKYSGYSDIALFTSFGAPFLLLADKKANKDALKIGFLYLETMMFMGNAYLWGLSLFERKRPYVYNPHVPIEKKLGQGTTNSFFAGHPAAAAAATFFVAKVFHDYHPDSKLRKFFWGAAIVPPAIVAYFRYKDGQHFPTDILAGIPLGAAIGILVPHFHKVRENSNTSFHPYPGGLGMIHRF